jgi:putative DNA primase/helicase
MVAKVSNLDEVRAQLDREAADSRRPAIEMETLGLSDDELASRFTERHAEDLRYVAAWDRWLIWDGARFARDERRRVFDLARVLCRDVLADHLRDAAYSETQRKALRSRLGAAATIWSVVKLAGSDPRHAVSPNQLDANPMALNTPGGIVDLRTGTIRPHDPLELHTKVTAATPAGTCPQFLATLSRAQPDSLVVEYLQRFFGYSLTGLSREHVLEFWFGGGRNLKGTIAHAFRRAMGDYAIEIAAETLMESHHDRHPTELAVLLGARLVIGSEVDTGRRWNEGRIKRLTGGDPISARYIGQDLFEFEPSHTLLIVGNSKPGLRQVDEAIRSRLHLVEFGVTIPEGERDTTMPEKLRAEEGGILAWALIGLADYLTMGLAAPESVKTSTMTYLLGEDMLQAWVDECTERAGQITLAAAHRSYREWCERNGAIVLGRNTFGDQLEARGFKRSSNRDKAAVFVGLSLPIAESPRYPD